MIARICLPVVGLFFSICASSALAWTYQDVRMIIEKDPNIRRIEDLLGRLDFELLDNYLFIHTSGSLQQASLETPRVILFTDDASFLMAFNGNPNFSGFNRLEMIQFNQANRKFEFYDAKFPEGNDGVVTFSEKNPEECQACHRTDLRPNWDSYPFWKSAFGSIEDSEGQRVDLFPEVKLFKKFVDASAQNPRYKHLGGLQGQSIERMAHRNLDFNRAVAFRNFQKIAAYLKTTPDYDKFKYAFLGAVRRCDIESYIPQSVRNKFANNIKYYIDQAAAFDLQLQHDRAAFVRRTETFYEPKVIGSLRYLLEGRHIPAGSWSMVAGEESYSLSTGSYGVRELAPVLLDQNPEMNGMACDDLQRKSLAALATPL